MAACLAVIVACGSSSTSTSASALESKTETHDLTSTSIDAGAPGDADASACHCAEVTIRCSVQGPYHARTDRATCTLELPPRACDVLGVEDGAKANPEALMAAQLPADLGADDVYEICTAKHEARHACDGAKVAQCTGEVEAYEVSVACMSAYVADPNVAFNIEGSIAAKEMNACLCTGASCSTCASRCRNDHPKFIGTCVQAEVVYCQ